MISYWTKDNPEAWELPSSLLTERTDISTTFRDVALNARPRATPGARSSARSDQNSMLFFQTRVDGSRSGRGTSADTGLHAHDRIHSKLPYHVAYGDKADRYLANILRTNLGTRRRSDGFTTVLGRRSCLDSGPCLVAIDGTQGRQKEGPRRFEALAYPP